MKGLTTAAMELDNMSMSSGYVEKAERRQPSFRLGGRPLRFLLLLLLSVSTVKSQEIGVDICACSPSVYTFQLNFNLTCLNETVSDNAGVLPPPNGFSCFVSPLRPEETITDFVPIRVSTVEILEVNRDDFVINNQIYDAGYFDGDTFKFVSIAGDTSTVQGLTVDDLPAGLQLNVVGQNSEEKDILNTWIVKFSNDCNAFPVLDVGDMAGWTVIVGLENAKGFVCPAASEAPSMYPSPSTRTPSSPPLALVQPSLSPSRQRAPTGSRAPTVSPRPSISSAPTISQRPSTSNEPSKLPSISPKPSTNGELSSFPSCVPSSYPTKYYSIEPTVGPGIGKGKGKGYGGSSKTGSSKSSKGKGKGSYTAPTTSQTRGYRKVGWHDYPSGAPSFYHITSKVSKSGKSKSKGSSQSKSKGSSKSISKGSSKSSSKWHSSSKGGYYSICDELPSLKKKSDKVSKGSSKIKASSKSKVKKKDAKMSKTSSKIQESKSSKGKTSSKGSKATKSNNKGSKSSKYYVPSYMPVPKNASSPTRNPDHQIDNPSQHKPSKKPVSSKPSIHLRPSTSPIPVLPTAPTALSPTTPVASPVATAPVVTPVTSSPTVPVAPPIATGPTAPVAAPVEFVPAPTVSSNSPTASISPVASPVASGPTAPVAPSASASPTIPVAPASPVAPGTTAPVANPAASVPTAPVAPSAASVPTSPVAPTSPVSSSPVASPVATSPTSPVAATSPVARVPTVSLAPTLTLNIPPVVLIPTAGGNSSGLGTSRPNSLTTSVPVAVTASPTTSP